MIDNLSSVSIVNSVHESADCTREDTEHGYDCSAVTTAAPFSASQMPNRVQLSFSAVTDVCSLIILVSAEVGTCTEQSISDIITNPAITYKIGDPIVNVPRPALGDVQANGCSVDCEIRAENPSNHAWWLDVYGADFIIHSNDVSVLGNTAS